MCAGALVQARMGQVIYGAEDNKRGGFGGTIDLSKHESAHHKMNVVGGILNQDCENKIILWFIKMRNQKKKISLILYQINLIIDQHSLH